MLANKTVEVFCSYTQTDETWLHELEAHLSLSKRQGLFTLWYPQLISPGTNKQQIIDTHLETADVILLLVSADFLASDYCYEKEMAYALERHRRGEAQVIPILIRQVDWKQAPFAHLSILPTNAKPLAMWADKDAALTDVAENLRRVIGGEPLLAANTPYPTLPSVWNVPYTRNPYFTGRNELLNQLYQQLASTRQDNSNTTRKAALTQPQAIKGLGGIGKTQLAVEYAYRHYQDYQVVLWIRADTHEALVSGYAEIAHLLNLSEKYEQDQTLIIKAVLQWLKSHTRWLLIFDNADDLSLIHSYLPQQGNGSILITTRANAVGPVAIAIEVEKMGLMEGLCLLLSRIYGSVYFSIEEIFEHVSDESVNEAGNIVAALDYLPLAIDQAGAYIEETGCSFVNYLQVYQDHRKELFAQRGMQATNYPDSVATTWLLSFQKIKQTTPAAIELLHLCAFLAPDKIPEELIRDGAAYWSPLLQQVATDIFAFNQMVAALLKFSLIKRLAETQALAIHRLVQAVQIDMMEPEVQRQWAERVVRAINEAFPHNVRDVTTWSLCFRYLNQVQVCSGLIKQYDLIFIEAAYLLNRTGLYLYEYALYTLAEPLHQLALSIWEQVLGLNHLEVASPLNDLANLYRVQGKYEQAELLYRRALCISEQVLSPEYTEVASSLNGLARLYSMQGKYEQAEPLFQRALRLWEQSLGQEHSSMASPLSGLASLYSRQGKYEQARLLYQRALRLWEQSLGPEHPHLAPLLNGLAVIDANQGRYKQAELMYQRVLHIWEKNLRPEHPDVAISLNRLAQVYSKQGKYEQAESLYQRALHISEQSLGSEHPDVASPLNNLAHLYSDQSKYHLAEPLYLRALHIREQSLGLEHPHTAFSVSGLAHLYFRQGKYEQAESLYQRALYIREQNLGPEHPEVGFSLSSLAHLYSKQSKYEQAEPLYQRALSIAEKKQGLQHPDLASPLNGLANLYRVQGKYEQAESLYQRVLHILEQNLGLEHPNIASSLNGLANLYHDQHREVEAEIFYQRALRIREEALGLEHADLASTLYDCAVFREAQGNPQEAALLYQRALTIRERVFDLQHPYTIETRERLRVVLHTLSRDEEATQLEVAQLKHARIEDKSGS